jgi:hypothetical protein
VITVARIISWRGPEPERFESAYVRIEGDTMVARGASVTAAYTLDYALDVGPRWRTRALTVRSHGNGWDRRLDLERAEDGAWSARWEGQGGEPLPDTLPDLDAALDCDLGLCPVTNTMPIRRLDLVAAAHRGEAVRTELLMAWVSVPDLAVHRSVQHYEASAPVASGGGALVRYASERFVTVLETDRDGLVVSYPALGREIDRICLG